VTRLWAGQPGFDSWQGRRDLFLFHHIHSSCRAHPASYPVSTWGENLALGIKWLGHEVDHSSPFSAKVKNVWNITFTPPYIFIAWCLIKGYIFMAWYLIKHRGNFTVPYLYSVAVN
jgi:hypothetical protein